MTVYNAANDAPFLGEMKRLENPCLMLFFFDNCLLEISVFANTSSVASKHIQFVT